MAQAKKPTNPTPIIKGAEDAGVEILAQSIVDISEGMKRINASRLSRRALVVLIKDATGVPIKTIETVLNGLSGLQATYVKPS